MNDSSLCATLVPAPKDGISGRRRECVTKSSVKHAEEFERPFADVVHRASMASVVTPDLCSSLGAPRRWFNRSDRSADTRRVPSGTVPALTGFHGQKAGLFGTPVLVHKMKQRRNYP
jgi:hypothetical protein